MPLIPAAKRQMFLVMPGSKRAAWPEPGRQRQRANVVTPACSRLTAICHVKKAETVGETSHRTRRAPPPANVAVAIVIPLRRTCRWSPRSPPW